MTPGSGHPQYRSVLFHWQLFGGFAVFVLFVLAVHSLFSPVNENGMNERVCVMDVSEWLCVRL